MSERLIVKSFGPVKELDIVFKAITILIGDQGTGKSCIAKLFSIDFLLCYLNTIE